MVGIEYDPVPVPRHRDVDRRDLLREDVLVVAHPGHPPAAGPEPVRIAACEHLPWATGHRPTSGLDAVLGNACNRLGGFEPEILHRSDDSPLVGALVAAGGAVALLPALVVPALPGIVPAACTRSGCSGPSSPPPGRRRPRRPVAAVRRAPRDTAAVVAARRDEVALVDAVG